MVQDDASKPRSYRALLGLVIFLGVLIVLGVGGLIAGIVFRAGNRTPAQNTPVLATLAAPGQHIESTQLDGNRILVRLAGSGGDELVVLDAASGRVTARIKLNTNP